MKRQTSCRSFMNPGTRKLKNASDASGCVKKEAGSNENGEQMEQIQRNTDRLSAREKLLERVKNFTLLSDVFLSVALRDKACLLYTSRCV